VMREAVPSTLPPYTNVADFPSCISLPTAAALSALNVSSAVLVNLVKRIPATVSPDQGQRGCFPPAI